jgi:hypothetical protein
MRSSSLHYSVSIRLRHAVDSLSLSLSSLEIDSPELKVLNDDGGDDDDLG